MDKLTLLFKKLNNRLWLMFLAELQSPELPDLWQGYGGDGQVQPM